MNYLLLILSGAVIGFIVAVPIGPVNLICIRRSLHYGSLNGFFSGLGSAVADTIFASISAFGLTWVTQLIEGWSTTLQVVGGIMLLAFGLETYISDPIAKHVDEGEPVREGEAASLARAIVSTFALTITNPAPLIGFAALFAGAGSLASQMVTFLDTAIVIAGVLAGSATWWFLLSTVVGLLHAKIDARVTKMINHGSGIVIALFGVAVLGHLVIEKFF